MYQIRSPPVKASLSAQTMPTRTVRTGYRREGADHLLRRDQLPSTLQKHVKQAHGDCSVPGDLVVLRPKKIHERVRQQRYRNMGRTQDTKGYVIAERASITGKQVQVDAMARCSRGRCIADGTSGCGSEAVSYPTPFAGQAAARRLPLSHCTPGRGRCKIRCVLPRPKRPRVRGG